MATHQEAIGVFDSGVGGLTVLARLAEQLPQECVIYLGDTARVPYGTKSAQTVTRYARACAAFLCEKGIKLLVVACNTASAHALDILRAELDIPVVGVVEPGAAAAVHRTKNKRVGVIGTRGTIQSGQYARVIQTLDPDIRVFTKACPLFVPLAEEGWTHGGVPREAAQIYLRELLAREIDTLVLGCTHYPLLKDVIAEVIGEDVALVDSAQATAAAVQQTLAGIGMLRTERSRPSMQHRFFVTDAPEAFARVGRRFLGRDIGAVEWVDF